MNGYVLILRNHRGGPAVRALGPFESDEDIGLLRDTEGYGRYPIHEVLPLETAPTFVDDPEP